MDKYDCIINLPHHVSSKRPQMPMLDRAAQFSPFAALTGYGDAIIETARQTEERVNMDEEAYAILNRKFRLLMEQIDELPEVSITYFEPDARKSGGAYLTATGTLKKLDEFERILVMSDGKKIRMDEVLDIDGDIFQQYHCDAADE